MLHEQQHNSGHRPGGLTESFGLGIQSDWYYEAKLEIVYNDWSKPREPK